MPNKKGSKVAASRARAQVKAHKKAHSTGPVVAAAAYAAPAAVDETAAEEATSAVATETSAPTDRETLAPARAAAPAVRRSNVSRTVSRQREAVVAMQSVNLKREVGTIASLAVVVGIALAVLKIATDIGV